MNRVHLITSAPLAIVAIVLTSSGARAGTTCTTDADCASGYLCNVVGRADWAAEPCAPGEVCPAPTEFEPAEIRECRPGATCTNDADCSPELRCFTSSYATCSGSASACSKEQTDCPPPPPPDCQVTTVTQCVSRYQSSCTADAECGPRLSCVPSQQCSCGASTPVTQDKTGNPPPPPPPEPCVCTNDGPPYCDLVNKACARTSDCPPDWTCEQTASSACSISSDGTPSCPPVPQQPMQCVPPHSSGVGTTPVVDGGTVGEDQGTPSDGNGGAGAAGAGTPTVETDRPTTPPAGPGNSGRGTRGRHTLPWLDPGGGISCQFSATSPPSSPTAWAALLGLVGLVALRRRRAAR
jgi:MYXO-CTERM domain-containing protein